MSRGKHTTNSRSNSSTPNMFVGCLNYMKNPDPNVVGNAGIYDAYVNRAVELCVNMFSWKTPKDVPNFFMEVGLINFGTLIAFRDRAMNKVFVTPYRWTEYNMYFMPKVREPYSPSDDFWEYGSYTEDDSVVLFDSMSHQPFMPVLLEFCNRIADTQRAIDMNIENTKDSKIIVTKRKLLDSIKRMFQDRASNKALVFADADVLRAGGNNGYNMDTLDFSSEFFADKLFDYKVRLWQELMNLRGYNNANTQKRERLVTDEVNANNESLKAILSGLLKQRTDFCEQANELLGLEEGNRFECELSLAFKDFYEDMFNVQWPDETTQEEGGKDTGSDERESD